MMSNPVRARTFTAGMATHRTGQVFVADTVKTKYNHYYVMTEAAKLTDAKTGAPFRKSGAFVVVADKYIVGPDSIGTVVAFLQQYHFRFTTKKGDLFYLR
jgi:hypothetical protein